MKDIRGKTEKELKAMLLEKQSALSTFRFGISGSKVRNMKEGRTVRKDIARVMTELQTQKSAKARAITA